MAIDASSYLSLLHAAASQVTADRDANLAELRETIERKCRYPMNAGNRKVIVFTAFADTAHYLYEKSPFCSCSTAGISLSTMPISGLRGSS